MSKPMSEWRKVAFGSSGAGLLMEDEYARALTVVGLVGECPEKLLKAARGLKHVDTSLLTVQLYHGQPPRPEFLPDEPAEAGKRLHILGLSD